MSVGPGMLGREVIWTLGGVTLAGVVSKGLSLSMTKGDTSDDNSSGNAEYHSTPLRFDETISISGKTKKLDLLYTIKTNVAAGKNIYTSTMTFPDGTTTPSVWAGDVFIDSFSLGSMEHESLGTFEAAMSVSGESTFTAAT